MITGKQRRAACEIWDFVLPLRDEVIEAYIDHTGRGKPAEECRQSLDNPLDRVMFDELCTAHRFASYFYETGWLQGWQDLTFMPGDFRHSNPYFKARVLRWAEEKLDCVPGWMKRELQ